MAGVFPSWAATRSIARVMLRVVSRPVAAAPVSASASAQRTVPAHVRKSLAVKSSPLISRRYALTSPESTLRRAPSSSTYWNSS